MEHFFIDKNKSELNSFITQAPPILNINESSKTLIIGETSSGKTEILESIISQILLMKSEGVSIGLTMIDSTGKLTDTLSKACNALNMDFTCLDTQRDLARFNPLEGETEAVVRNMTCLIDSVIGYRDKFLKGVQHTTLANIIRLLKRLHKNNVKLEDVLGVLTDSLLLDMQVVKLITRDGEDELTRYFQNEFLSYKRYSPQFLKGVAIIFEDLIANKGLYRTTLGESDFSYKKILSSGGILSVATHTHSTSSENNSALLGRSALIHLQEAVNELCDTPPSSLTPHFVIVDDCDVVLYEEILNLFDKASDLNISLIFTAKTIEHLFKGFNSSNAHYLNLAMLLSFQNKILLGNANYNDATYFADLFSAHPELQDKGYLGGLITTLPPMYYIYQNKYQGELSKPSLSVVDTLPNDFGLDELRKFRNSSLGAVLINHTKADEW